MGILLKYDLKKLPLWTRATYGGEVRTNSNYNPSAQFNVFKVTVAGRPVTHGMLMYVDSGRCSMVGRTEFSKCGGKHNEVFAMQLVAGMFERWETPNPTTYLFHVRPGMLWPNIPPMVRTDRTVTAADLAWYLNTQKDGGLFAGTFLLAKSIEAIDAKTVKVTLSEPHADFLRLLAVQTMGVQAPECHNNALCLEKAPVSPGPFLVDEIVLRQRASFKKNPEFHLPGMPYVDRIVTINITDPAAAKSAFITGQVQTFGANDVAEMEGVVKQLPTAQVQAMALAMSAVAWRPKLTGAMADVRVRRALTMTLDYPTMWAAVKGDFGIFPLMYGRDYAGPDFFPRLAEQGESYQFNPEKAKRLMAEAGYPNGFNVTVATGSTSGYIYELGIWAQAQWKKHLGVTVTVKTVDAAAFTSSLFDKSWDGLYTHGCWTPTCWNTADESFLQLVKGSVQNFQGVDDPFINDLYVKQRSEMDPTRRLKLLQEFDRYEQDQVYVLRITVLNTLGILQPTEMNGAYMATCFYSPISSCGWLAMQATTAPSAR
ncbi:MAG: ABC transporter substrate-binding protein [SAR202 cluster bacterium]|nr:ABC transporter substrate-binding protein [SAR202 cluster bacterium]